MSIVFQGLLVNKQIMGMEDEGKEVLEEVEEDSFLQFENFQSLPMKVRIKDGKVVEILGDVEARISGHFGEDYDVALRPLIQAGVEVRFESPKDEEANPEGFVYIKKEGLNDALKEGKIIIKKIGENDLRIETNQ